MVPHSLSRNFGRWFQTLNAASLKWTMQRPNKNHSGPKELLLSSGMASPNPWYKHTCYEDHEAWNLMIVSATDCWRHLHLVEQMVLLVLVAMSSTWSLNAAIILADGPLKILWKIIAFEAPGPWFREIGSIAVVFVVSFWLCLGEGMCVICFIYVSNAWFFRILLRLPEFNKVALSCNISTGK